MPVAPAARERAPDPQSVTAAPAMPPKEPVDWERAGDSVIAAETGLPREMLNCTLRDLVRRFKGVDGVERFARLLRDFSAADEKEQKIQARRLKLIEKEFVQAHVISLLDTLFERLLSVPKSVSVSILALAMSKGFGARSEIEGKLKKTLSDILLNSKNAVIESLKTAKLADSARDFDRKDEIKEAVSESLEEIYGGN